MTTEKMEAAIEEIRQDFANLRKLEDQLEATRKLSNLIASTRACFFCGKVLSAHAGFIETVHQPDGLRRDFCSAECLHWQLHEDEKADR